MENQVEAGIQNLAQNPESVRSREKVIGKFKIFLKNTLGRGHDTKVYRGKFEGRDVAIKRLSFEEEADQKKALNEIEHLLKADKHENVVKYFAKEVVEDEFIYIALEYCELGNLHDWVLNPSTAASANYISNVNILEQATRGLEHLHKLNIIHRDVKPHNILLSLISPETVRVRISDFGISRRLQDGRSSQTLHTGSGTFGWMAPEILQFRLQRTSPALCAAAPKMTRQTDIFSLGLVYYFVLSGGKHPFGTNDIEHPTNILNYAISIEQNVLADQKCVLESLIRLMVAKEPKDRPPASFLFFHNLFWTNEKKMNFLVAICKTFDDFYVTDEVRNCKIEVHKYTPLMKLFPWPNNLSYHVKNYVRTNGFSSYDENNALDLIRYIRNIDSHYGNLPKNVKAELEREGGVKAYWFLKFPFLVDVVWGCFSRVNGLTEIDLDDYYGCPTLEYSLYAKKCWLIRNQYTRYTYELLDHCSVTNFR